MASTYILVMESGPSKWHVLRRRTRRRCRRYIKDNESYFLISTFALNVTSQGPWVAAHRDLTCSITVNTAIHLHSNSRKGKSHTIYWRYMTQGCNNTPDDILTYRNYSRRIRPSSLSLRYRKDLFRYSCRRRKLKIRRGREARR